MYSAPIPMNTYQYLVLSLDLDKEVLFLANSPNASYPNTHEYIPVSGAEPVS